jgi:(methylthio)acryloyl-CoA hydratase
MSEPIESLDNMKEEPSQMEELQSASSGRPHIRTHAENDKIASRRVSPDRLIVSQRGPVTVVRLSRPAKNNALDEKMITGIKSFFSTPPEGTRAVVLHGEGKHFSAGFDLSAIAGSTANLVRGSRTMQGAFDQLEYSGVPVIAVLHGAVVGAGFELAATAHIRVAERNAYYVLPEGIRGIFVGAGGAARIPRLIGTSRMIDMMLTGRTYDAQEGALLGFSQYLVDDGRGVAKGVELAERIAANAELSNFAVVQALPRIARADPDTGLLLESLMVAIAASDDEAKIRIRAFLEKQAPKALQNTAIAK